MELKLYTSLLALECARMCEWKLHTRKPLYTFGRSNLTKFLFPDWTPNKKKKCQTCVRVYAILVW